MQVVRTKPSLAKNVSLQISEIWPFYILGSSADTALYSETDNPREKGQEESEIVFTVQLLKDQRILCCRQTSQQLCEKPGKQISTI